MHASIVIIFVLACLCHQNEALTCFKCVKEELCKDNDLSKCLHGLASDMCGCCDVCAKGPGEECGGIWNHGGTCGKGLACQPHPDPKRDQDPGTCSRMPLPKTDRPKF